MRPARTAARVLAVAAALATASASAALAQRTGPLPDELAGVGITEHLDEALPLDLVLTDERGNDVRLGSFFADERPVILTLVYYECPMLCTLVLNGLVDALSALEWSAGREFEIVTVSIDPTETPALAGAKKKAYLERYGRPEARTGWHFLTAEADAIRSLADAVGFRYRYLEDRGEFAHSAAIFLATPDGRLARYLYGVQYGPETLRLALVESSEGRIGSTLDQFILYCFHYDAAEGRYTPAAMKIMRLGGAATVLVLAVTLVVFWRRETRRKTAWRHT